MVTKKSFLYAIRGIKLVLSAERNARIHLCFALAAIIAGLIFKISVDEFLVIILSIILVFFAEIINTAIEKTLDLTYSENSQMVRFVKDTTAAGVLVTATGSVVVALLIFGPKILEAF